MPVDRLVFVQVFRLTCQNTQTHWVLTGSPPTNMFDMFVYFGLQINFLESLGDWSIAGGINAATTVIFLRKHIYAIHTRSYIQHIYLHIYIYTYIYISLYILVFIYILIYHVHMMFFSTFPSRSPRTHLKVKKMHHQVDPQRNLDVKQSSLVV